MECQISIKTPFKGTLLLELHLQIMQYHHASLNDSCYFTTMTWLNKPKHMSNLKLIERRGAICSDCFCQRHSALMACANTLPAKKDFVRNKVMSLAVVPSLRYQGALGGGGWQERWVVVVVCLKSTRSWNRRQLQNEFFSDSTINIRMSFIGTYWTSLTHQLRNKRC